MSDRSDEDFDSSGSTSGTEALLRTIVALLMERRGSDAGDESPEVFLDAMGIDQQAIAVLLRKKPDAVRMKLSRHRKSLAAGSIGGDAK